MPRLKIEAPGGNLLNFWTAESNAMFHMMTQILLMCVCVGVGVSYSYAMICFSWPASLKFNIDYVQGPDALLLCFSTKKH